MAKTAAVLSAAILVVLIFGSANAQEQTKAQEPTKASPKYLNLRYDEDFSYLGGSEESYTKDLWDTIKWIKVAENLHLTIGGQARVRFESETNRDFGTAEPSHDAFGLQRYFIHADLRHADGLRFFLQGKFAYVNDRDRGGLAGLEDHADFHQAFVDIPIPVSDQTVTLRLGRQELQYGKSHLLLYMSLFLLQVLQLSQNQRIF